MPDEPLSEKERSENLRAKFDAAMLAMGGRTAHPGEMTRTRRRIAEQRQ